MSLFSKIKTSLRISNTAFDEEIQDLIDAAKADMVLVGIISSKIVDTDSLIIRAITVYCKANFGWDNPDAEKLQRSYEMLRNHLSQSIDYAVEEGES